MAGIDARHEIAAKILCSASLRVQSTDEPERTITVRLFGSGEIKDEDGNRIVDYITRFGLARLEYKDGIRICVTEDDWFKFLDRCRTFGNLKWKKC